MAIIKRVQGERMTYIVRVRDADGQWFKAKSFDIKIDARNYEAELMAAKAKGSRAREKSLNEFDLNEYWSKWSTECRGKTSAGWRLSQDQMWRDHIAPVIGKISLIEAKTEHILKVINSMRAKGLGNQMGIHVHCLLHQMFDDAIEIYDIRESNPVKRKLKPDAPTTRREYLTPEEAFLFLAHVKDHYLGPPIWIMVLCGLRIGEVQALTRECIDFDTRTLNVTRQWNSKEKRFGPVKNRRSISIPMPSALSEYLASRLASLSPQDFACPSTQGAMLSYDTFYGALRRFSMETKLKEISPHELRHSCSEIWIRNGATQEDLRRLFNHRSAASTKVYIHETSERLRAISEVILPAHVH